MTQIFNIQNDKVVIDKLILSTLEGPVALPNTLDINGSINLNGDLTVSSTIIAQTIQVDNLITKHGVAAELGNWVTNSEEELVGKGFSWAWGNGNIQLIYRNGNRLWTNGDFDLIAEAAYKIDNIPVLTVNSLGTTITNSNLRKVGPLNSLTVTGDANIGEFAFFNTSYNRLGLGTEDPNASISIIDNDVEIALGSPKVGLATVGTYSNHDFAITSDNIPRITVKHNGEVHISDEISKSGVLRVFGSIYASNIEADTRIERTSSLEFKGSQHDPIYNKGLVWLDSDCQRSFVLVNNPDRLKTQVSIEIGAEQAYYINGNPVIYDSKLGDCIRSSNLTSVGQLTSLVVAGEAAIADLSTDNLKSTLGTHSLTITGPEVTASSYLALNIANQNILFADSSETIIGNINLPRRPVKVFGSLSVGVNNPDPTVSLSVNGNVSFNNKKFVTGIMPPNEGVFYKGDICWNQNPTITGYVGWICLVDGQPGEWEPFGAIGR